VAVEVDQAVVEEEAAAQRRQRVGGVEGGAGLAVKQPVRQAGHDAQQPSMATIPPDGESVAASRPSGSTTRPWGSPSPVARVRSPPPAGSTASTEWPPSAVT